MGKPVKCRALLLSLALCWWSAWASAAPESVRGAVVYPSSPKTTRPATVVLYELPCPALGEPMREIGKTLTGADGKFSFGGTPEIQRAIRRCGPAWLLCLRVEHPDFADGFLVIKTPKRLWDLQVRLTERVRVEVTILDGDGEPVPGAKVWSWPKSVANSLAAYRAWPGALEALKAPGLTITDAGGKAKLHNVSKDGRIDFFKKGRPEVADPYLRATGDSSRSITITLEKDRWAGATGVVRDKKTRKPVPNAIVMLSGRYGQDYFWTRADAQGRYMLPGIKLNRRPRRGSRRAVVFNLTAWAVDESGRASAAGERHLSTGEATVYEHMDVLVTRGRIISGRIVNIPDGKPVADVAMMVYTLGKSLPYYTGYSDKDGAFFIRTAAEPMGVSYLIMGIPDGFRFQVAGPRRTWSHRLPPGLEDVTL
ncbi:MAG: hypothetical protein ACTSWM_09170, partial [Alphaproteobacteria bacterium]